ncbi:hypothetical protein ATO12_04185 [Aquimarina atlantica]|uniref:Uncharacterized protein n=1 Tax=Aquimarina atlantica TaxID=1317122 RepID=A0A023C107_9FLAO|nr:hypothetical protein ATO12_04185 [Aquimarina atlantica]
MQLAAQAEEGASLASEIKVFVSLVVVIVGDVVSFSKKTKNYTKGKPESLPFFSTTFFIKHNII